MNKFTTLLVLAMVGLTVADKCLNDCNRRLAERGVEKTTDRCAAFCKHSKVLDMASAEVNKVYGTTAAKLVIRLGPAAVALMKQCGANDLNRIERLMKERNQSRLARQRSLGFIGCFIEKVKKGFSRLTGQTSRGSGTADSKLLLINKWRRSKRRLGTKKSTSMIKQAISKTCSSIKGKTKGLIKKAVEKAGKVEHAVKETVKGAANKAKHGIERIKKAAVEKVKEVISKPINAAKKVIENESSSPSIVSTLFKTAINSINPLHVNEHKGLSSKRVDDLKYLVGWATAKKDQIKAEQTSSAAEFALAALAEFKSQLNNA